MLATPESRSAHRRTSLTPYPIYQSPAKKSSSEEKHLHQTSPTSTAPSNISKKTSKFLAITTRSERRTSDCGCNNSETNRQDNSTGHHHQVNNKDNNGNSSSSHSARMRRKSATPIAFPIYQSDKDRDRDNASRKSTDTSPPQSESSRRSSVAEAPSHHHSHPHHHHHHHHGHVEDDIETSPHHDEHMCLQVPVSLLGLQLPPPDVLHHNHHRKHHHTPAEAVVAEGARRKSLTPIHFPIYDTQSGHTTNNDSEDESLDTIRAMLVAGSASSTKAEHHRSMCDLTVSQRQATSSPGRRTSNGSPKSPSIANLINNFVYAKPRSRRSSCSTHTVAQTTTPVNYPIYDPHKANKRMPQSCSHDSLQHAAAAGVQQALSAPNSGRKGYIEITTIKVYHDDETSSCDHQPLSISKSHSSASVSGQRRQSSYVSQTLNPDSRKATFIKQRSVESKSTIDSGCLLSPAKSTAPSVTDSRRGSWLNQVEPVKYPIYQSPEVTQRQHSEPSEMRRPVEASVQKLANVRMSVSHGCDTSAAENFSHVEISQDTYHMDEHMQHIVHDSSSREIFDLYAKKLSTGAYEAPCSVCVSTGGCANRRRYKPNSKLRCAAHATANSPRRKEHD